MSKNKQENLFEHGHIKGIDINDEMRSSYIEYAMSVLVGRALPDVRDGLKPVHRRILFAMHDQGFTSGKPYRKCARIVGEVLGKYHPHGDTAVYDSLVRMAQDFSLRYPLIDGQGNFGSIDGDNAAAMRYTEARMSKIAMEMLEDINKNTVDTTPNFDDSLQEPTVLPALIPNLLVNGSSGIAVGMATNIPPHNLGEVVDGMIKLINNPEIEIRELAKSIKGPDFPTGGIICGRKGILEAYETGRGKVICRGIVEEELGKRGKDQLIITAIPYQVNKNSLIIKIAELVQSKKIKGISDVRDESDRKGMRVVIELKKDTTNKVVINQLFKHTQLQVTFGCNFIAIVDKAPRLLNLKQIMVEYLKHREVVVVRRTQFDLDKAKARLHIVEGLRIAVNNIDEVIKLIKSSKDVPVAREGLMSKFKLSELQANAILEMRLQKLTNLEIDHLEAEYKELVTKIKDLEDILSNRKRVLQIITDELLALKQNYKDKRLTNFEAEAEDVDIDDLIPEENVAVIMTKEGFVKRLPIDTFRSQMRGGRGVNSMTTGEEDLVDKIFVTSTHSYLLCFTNWGKVYKTKVYDLPDASRQSKGVSIANHLQINKNETIATAVAVDKFDDEDLNLIFATRNGTVKKTPIKDFQHIRNNGIIAIKLDQNDELLWVRAASGKPDVFLSTKKAMTIRFKQKDLRSMGRSARGVRGIRLKKDDAVVSMEIVEDSSWFFVITKHGFGKNTRLDEYRCIGRGGQGVRLIKLRDDDEVARARVVLPEDELLIVTKNGTLSRQKIKNISTQGRSAMGVRIQRVDEGDEVVDIARVISEEI